MGWTGATSANYDTTQYHRQHLQLMALALQPLTQSLRLTQEKMDKTCIGHVGIAEVESADNFKYWLIYLFVMAICKSSLQFISLVLNSNMINPNDSTAQLNQAYTRILNDILYKIAILQNPNGKETSYQIKQPQLKYPVNKTHVKKGTEVYQKILNHISQFQKAKQTKKMDENTFLTLLAKKDKTQMFNILNKNLKVSEHVATGITDQICLGNQTIENMKDISQSLQISDLPQKSVISQIKSLVKLRQNCIKQQRVHYLFTQLNSSKFDQSSNFVKQQLSETFRQQALKYIEDSKGINGHIDNIYKLLNNKYVKYRSDVQMVAYKDPNKALNDICKQIDRRSTTVYGFVQEVQKLNFISNKPKGVNGNIKFSDKLQNILNLLRGANEGQEKLRKIKSSYQALIYMLNQHKNLLDKIKERNARKIVIDVQKNLEETLKQYQKEFRTHFEAALASAEKNIELKNAREQMNKALTDIKFPANKTNANTETNALKARITALQQNVQEKVIQVSKHEAKLREQANVITQLQNIKHQLEERVIQLSGGSKWNQYPNQYPNNYPNAMKLDKGPASKTNYSLIQRPGSNTTAKQLQESIATSQQLRSKVTRLQDMISSKDSELTKCKKQLQTASNKYKTQIDDLKYKMTAINKKNAQQSQVIINLRQQIGGLQQLRNQLQAQLKQLKQKNNQLVKSNSANLKQLQIKQKEITEIQQRHKTQLQHQQSSADQYKIKYEHEKGQHANLKKLVDEQRKKQAGSGRKQQETANHYKQQVQKLNRALGQLRQQLQKQVENSKQKESTLHNRINELATQLQQQSQKRTQKAEEQRFLMNNSEILSSSLEQNKIRRQEDEAKIATLEQNNKELLEKHHKSIDEIKGLEKQVAYCRDQHNMLEHLKYQLNTYKDKATQHLKEKATPIELLLVDRLFQGELLADQVHHKYTIVKALEKLEQKQISGTKLLYKYDPRNTASFHSYIDGAHHMLLVVKSSKGVFLAGYNSGEYNEKIQITGPGLLISLKRGETFELYNSIANRRYPCRAMTYDKFYLNYGNSEIRMKWTDIRRPELFSNFGVSNSYFNNREFKVDDLLGEGEARETTFENFEIYEISYLQSQNGCSRLREQHQHKKFQVNHTETSSLASQQNPKQEQAVQQTNYCARENIQQTHSKQNEEITKCHLLLQQKDKEIKGLQEQVATLKLNIDEINKAKTLLNTQLLKKEQAITENASLISEYAQKETKMIQQGEDLRRQLQSSQQELSKRIAELQQLQKRYQQERNRQNSSTSQRQSSYQLEITELKQIIKTKQSELKTKQIHLQTSKKQLEAQLASIKSDLQHKSKQLLEEQRRNFNQLKRSSEKQAQNSKYLLQKANTKIQQLQSELKEKKKKINDLSKMQEELTKNIGGLKDKLKAEEQQSWQLSTKIQQLQDKKNSQQSQSREKLESLKTQFQAQISNLQAKLQLINKEKRHLQEKLQSTVVSLTKEIEKSQRLRMQLQQQKGQISKLQADLQSSRQAHNKNVQNLRKQHQVKEKKLKSQKEAVEKQLTQQVKTTSKIQQNFEVLEAQLKQKETELDLIKEQIKSSAQSLTQKEEEIMRIQGQNDGLQSSLQENAIKMNKMQRELNELREEKNKFSQSYFTELQKNEQKQKQIHSLTLHFDQQLKKEKQVIHQLDLKNIQLERKLKQLQQKVKGGSPKLPKQLVSYYENAAQKHPEKQINPLDLLLLDRFLQGELLREQVLHKHTIIKALEKLQKKTVSRTKLLYKYDPRNITTSFHSYIDGTHHMLLVVKSSKGVFLAGYNSGEYNEKIQITGPGLLISLKRGETFELYSNTANRRYPCRAMTYDKFYLNYGNSEIRMKWTDIKKPELFSNFGVSNSYFNNREFKVDDLLGEGQARETTFESFEIYEIQYQQQFVPPTQDQILFQLNKPGSGVQRSSIR